VTGQPLARALLALLLLAGCATATGRIENGMFYSVKGYRVTLPPTGWRVDAGQRADLALRGEAQPGGMVVDATCTGRESTRPLDVLENGTSTVGGREAAHSVVRGLAEGRTVTVEALVVRAEPCVHDFLYVAPSEAFDGGRPAFRALVESFALEPRR